MDIKTKLKCRCGREKDLFFALAELGFDKNEMRENFLSFASKAKRLLPKLVCKQCGLKGFVRPVFPKSNTLPEMNSRPGSFSKKFTPFSKRLVASDRAVTRVFHKQSCMYAKKIRREDEVFFRSKEDAIKRSYYPCPRCRP